MGGYVEDYRLSSNEEKLVFLNNLYNKENITESEKQIILRETQRIYNIIKNRS